MSVIMLPSVKEIGPIGTETATLNTSLDIQSLMGL